MSADDYLIQTVSHNLMISDFLTHELLIQMK